MKILYITEAALEKKFGVSQVVRHQASALHNAGHEIAIACYSGDTFANEEIKIILLKEKGIFLYRQIKNIIRHVSPDLIHIHGIWRPIHIFALMASGSLKIPSILSPHGGVMPWQINGRGLVKQVYKKAYIWFFFKALAFKPSIFHAITNQEEAAICKFIDRNSNIFTVPNCINVQSLVSPQVTLDKSITYIGRLDPVKGIDLLIKAFIEVHDPSWTLNIYGPCKSAHYLNYLKGMSSTHPNIIYHGPIYNENKINVMRKSWVLALPSYSEVIGMINLESALLGTPTVTSTITGLVNWDKSGGVLVEPEVNSIVSALKNIMAWSLEERQFRGKQIQAHVVDNYCCHKTMLMFEQTYIKLIERSCEEA